jgi:hypothetical protein
MRKPTDFRPVFVFLRVFCDRAERALQRLCKTGHATRRVFFLTERKRRHKAIFYTLQCFQNPLCITIKQAAPEVGFFPSLERLIFYFNPAFLQD